MSLSIDTASTSSPVAPALLRTVGEGETITVKDILDLAGVSKVTLLKMIESAGIVPVGKVVSGGRGRPAFLFDRADVQRMLDARSTGKVTKDSKLVAVAPVNDTADAVAEPDDDSVDPDLAAALAAQQE
jgi:hypothetical protein